MDELKYYFDESLREIPVDKEKMTSYVSEYKDDISIENKSYIAPYLRILGELEKSENYLLEVINFYEKENNELKVFLNKIKLGIVYQWQNNFVKSNKLFDELLCICENFPNHKDFLFQHIGKNYFEQQNYILAKQFFQKALNIRKIKNNKELLESTEFALEVCNKKIISK